MLLVRNTAEGPTVFSDVSKNIALEWQAAGDPNGEDVQQVPDELHENVNFMKVVQRGILIIEEASDSIREAFAKQQAAFEQRTSKAAAAATAVIDQEAQNDLITVPCIGPNQRGSGECGEPVPVREKTKDEKPPLCSRHSALASQYIVSETETLIEGKAQKRWTRAGVTPHEKQMQ